METNNETTSKNFRTILWIVLVAALAFGAYYAYTHMSGVAVLVK